MIVDGSGMLARAFWEHSRPDLPSLIFARGVADSSCVDEREYTRETAMLRSALARAADVDVPLVYFSGAHLYGHFDSVMSETSPIVPFTRYGTHQVDCEAIVRAGPAGHLILRLPNVVGPYGNVHQLVPSLVWQSIQGQVTVQADATRDLIGVDDLVTITERLLRNGARNVTVNVASGISTGVPTIVSDIVATLRLQPEVISRSGGDRQRFDIALLRSLIGELPFDTSYPERLLRAYVPRIAASITEPAAGR